MADFHFHNDDRYVLNYCAKYLGRFNTDRRHSYGSGAEAPRDRIAEAWRFPIIDTYGGGASGITAAASYQDYNQVTFVYAGADTQSPGSVAVIGTFATLYDPIPLQRVQFEGEDTRYWSLAYAVPKGQVHNYRFVVDGSYPINDPVNPQETATENGAVWSSFFTDGFSSPLVLEKWEIALLYRLTAGILPFQTADGTNFLDRFYNYLDRQKQADLYNNVYRMDNSVGEINYIDNILAREERHHLADYKTCLRQIDRILRTRNPYTEPSRMSRELYFALYDEMATDRVDGWDYALYGSPQYFLYLLRRHVVTGAFCHPKYGGNAGAAGWAYLSDQYRLPSPAPGKHGATLFDWRRAMESPLGVNSDYLG
ncbi:gluconate 2-dehydrogenase subunit 3 family protein [Pedosphaera parvula]|nr:gluconate 2-dehydrogenase subunit 3 family protein [Pedosphaera parvula]